MFENINEIEITLSELVKILDEENELNWSRGINSALLHTQAGTEEEYLLARSIYKTMCNGGAGFMEYYIKRKDFKDQQRANARLDSARDKLWDLFSY